ncbi:hypothetical protein FKR81_37200 [Lentzea tibetensis]|uniref:Uncharacterized protein n=1 Tax=Lentzea tibetensis TaxID=2591470 RepID=A0A563EJ22_9PSEU|nr:hypothetical protein [Lentzea tibetensis]TWP46023.1 hypothetical protein FKR81_37200 [Lentzea tibetensis]
MEGTKEPRVKQRDLTEAELLEIVGAGRGGRVICYWSTLGIPTGRLPRHSSSGPSPAMVAAMPSHAEQFVIRTPMAGGAGGIKITQDGC